MKEQLPEKMGELKDDIEMELLETEGDRELLEKTLEKLEEEKPLKMAIEEKIKIIEECKTICDFILNHYGLQKAFQGYLDKKADERDKAEIYKVLEYYGLTPGYESNVEALYKITYNKIEHIDIITKYLALKNIKFDRDNFIYKEAIKDEGRNYKPGKGPNFTGYVPQNTPGN